MKKFSALLVALCLCIWLCACDTYKEQLPAPQNLHMESKVLVWDRVEHATEYRVYVENVGHATPFLHYDLSELSVPGTYEISVMAIGDEKYSNSVRAHFTYTVTAPEEEDSSSSGGKDDDSAKYDETGFEYNLLPDGSGYEVSAGKISAFPEHLELPDTFKGLPVKYIPKYAFSGPGWNVGNVITTSIKLPAHLESIGQFAFKATIHLEELVIPDSVSEIEYGAFSTCFNLKHVKLSKNLKVLGGACFSGCALEEIVLPDGLEEIGESAFRSDKEYYPQAYTSIAIPNSVKRIETLAFACEALQEVTLSTENLEWIITPFRGSAWEDALPAGPIIIGDLLYKYNKDNPETYTVPAGVKKIAGRAFAEAGTDSHIVEVAIPDGVKLIGDCIFDSCENLKRVRLPADLTEIPERIFSGCENLTDIVIPESVTTIGNYAFQYCENLSGISLPAGLETLGDCAFEYCISMKDIVIPASLENLGKDVFNDCDALEKVFYEGTKQQLDELIAQNNAPIEYPNGVVHEFSPFANATVYCYAETKPISGNYWHYVNGTPTIW